MEGLSDKDTVPRVQGESQGFGKMGSGVRGQESKKKKKRRVGGEFKNTTRPAQHFNSCFLPMFHR